MKMIIRNFLFAGVALAASAAGLRAGAITGTVNGAKAGSVVYVDAIPGKTFPAAEKPTIVDQKSLLFMPHVVAVSVGSTVEFMNNDKVQHNIFWPSISGNKKLSHNMGTWPQGEQRAFKFDMPGVVPLLCNVHPEMSGYIVVSPTPYFAVTDETGKFKIDVPDGAYTLQAWHEGMKLQAKPVTLAGSASVDFSLTK